MNDFDDIIRQAPAAPQQRKVKAPLWVRVWFCGLTVGLTLALLLAVSTSVRSSNNAALIQSNAAAEREMAKLIGAVQDEAEADRLSVAALRKDTIEIENRVIALVGENTRQIGDLARSTGAAFESLQTMSKANSESLESLARIEARQDKSIGELRSNQQLVGKAIKELTLTQAKMFEAMKRVTESVNK